LGIARLALLGWLIGRVFAGDELPELMVPLMTVALVIVLRGVMEHVRAIVAHQTAARVQMHLRRLLFDQVTALGPGYVGQQRSGDVTLSLVDGVEQLEVYFGQYLPQLLISLLTPLLIFACVAWLDFPVAVVMLGFALIALFAPALWHQLDSRKSNERANWTFQHAWCGGLRSFITGVRCACLAAVMVPCLLVLLPLHVYLLGATAAALHAVAGLLVASVLLDLILLGREKPPFISSYMPEGRLKLAPIYLLGAAAVASSVAWLERAAAGAWPYALAFAAGSVALIAAVRAIDTRRGSAEPVALEDQDENTAQRLGLADHT
jgi:small basic protein